MIQCCTIVLPLWMSIFSAGDAVFYLCNINGYGHSGWATSLTVTQVQLDLQRVQPLYLSCLLRLLYKQSAYQRNQESIKQCHLLATLCIVWLVNGDDSSTAPGSTIITSANTTEYTVFAPTNTPTFNLDAQVTFKWQENGGNGWGGVYCDTSGFNDNVYFPNSSGENIQSRK